MSDRGTVVITGASTGIGRACALRLDELGFGVIAGVRQTHDADALRTGASARLRTVIVDVTEPASIERLATCVGDRPLAGLVNNAGIAVGGPLEFVALDDLRRQFEVNVVGLVAVTQALLGPLRAGTGRVVNIGSMSGRRAAPFLGPYAASKHAVEAITEALRQELRPWGIRVALIEPGLIATPIWEKGRRATDDIEAAMPTRGRALYGDAIAGMRRATEQAVTRALPPERVAGAVEQALTVTRPRTRYVVGLEGRVQTVAGTLLPDRVMDALVARMMALPREARA